jgi:hypothetical protein
MRPFSVGYSPALEPAHGRLSSRFSKTNTRNTAHERTREFVAATVAMNNDYGVVICEVNLDRLQLYFRAYVRNSARRCMSVSSSGGDDEIRVETGRG